MIEHIWSILCLKSVIDQETNNMSLIDTLEQLNLTLPPLPTPTGIILIPINYELVSFFSRREENLLAKGEGCLILFGPTGNALDEPTQYAIDLSVTVRHRQRTRIGGFPYVGPGRYTFAIQIRNEGQQDWKDSVRVPIVVNVQDAPPQPAPQTHN